MYSAETPYRLVPAPPRMALLPSGVDEDCLSDYQTADDATVNTVRTANTMDEQTARRKYGLKNWRKYALYKHGNNPKFLNSTQGREILKANFRNEMKQDLDGLARWINAVDSAEAAMEEELHQTRAENAALMSRVVDTERLLGIQDQITEADGRSSVAPSDVHKIQYVVLLEKKLSVATWEADELRVEVAALKLASNNDTTTSKLKAQLESVTRQRDELLRDHGSKARENEERERNLAAQLDDLSRARAAMAEECARIESDSANRVESLFSKLEVIQRQRDDLLMEQRMWRREKEEMVESMLAQMNDLSKQKEQLTTENMQLRTQIVHLTPINVEAGASRFKAAPASLSSGSAVVKMHGDAVPEKKPPSASLKSKLEEWNKQRDRMAEEQQSIREQEATADKPTPAVSSKTSVQSVLSAISPSSILGSVKKLANGGVVETGSAPTNAAAVGPDVRSQVSPISAMNMESGTVRVQSSPLAPIPKTLETAKDRIRQILADSDDEDLAISAALSKATNLVEEVRGGSGMSK